MAPRCAGFFKFSFSERSRSISAFSSSSVAIVCTRPPVIAHGSLRFPTMPDFQAIFFDFDGVLLDTEPVHWECWAEMLRTVGLELTWEYYRDHCIGIDDRDMLRVIARNAD